MTMSLRDGEEPQTDEVPIIDSNRDLKERFDERFFKSHIFFDKIWMHSFFIMTFDENSGGKQS